MEDYGYEFYHLDPPQIMELPVEIYPQAEVKELAYYVWAVFPEDEVLMAWREVRVLPLIRAIPEDEEI